MQNNKPKKILIDARMAGTQNAGIGRSIEELIKNLFRIDTGNEYYLFLTKENFSLFDELNTKRVHKVLLDVRWYTLKEQFVVPKEIRKINPDLMYFPHFNVPLFYFGKFIVTIHDLIWIKYPRPRREVSTLGPFLYGIKNFFSKIIFRFAVKRAQKIIVPTMFTKSDIMGFYKIPSEKIEVVNWGIENLSEDHSSSTEEKSDNVLKKCYNINRRYLLYAGSAYPHKNLIFLVEVFKEISDGVADVQPPPNPLVPPAEPMATHGRGRGLKTPQPSFAKGGMIESSFQKGEDVQLILAGKDSYFYQKLKQKVLELNLEDKVVFTGYVEDKELDLLYRNSLMFVFPSFLEGFGFPPLEAMRKGIPVFSSNSSCLPEVLGDAVLYFDPEDKEDFKNKILSILKDENFRRELVEKGFEQVRKYDWIRCAEGYLENFKKETRYKKQGYKQISRYNSQ